MPEGNAHTQTLTQTHNEMASFFGTKIFWDFQMYFFEVMEDFRNLVSQENKLQSDDFLQGASF